MNLNEYLNCHKSRSFSETLFSFIDKSGFKDSMIYKKADIDRKLFLKSDVVKITSQEKTSSSNYA